MNAEFTMREFARIAKVQPRDKPHVVKIHYDATCAILNSMPTLSAEDAWAYVKSLILTQPDSVLIDTLAKLERNRRYTRDALERVINQM